MASVFWDSKGVLLVDFMPSNTTINSDAYCATLECLRRAIQNRRRGKLSRGIVLLHDNARPHTARQTQALLLKQLHWDIFEHHPYSPDRAPSEFFLFPKMKSNLLVNASQMIKTWRMLSWPGWITRRPHGMKRVYTNWCQGTTSALISKATVWNSRQRYVPKLVYSAPKNQHRVKRLLPDGSPGSLVFSKALFLNHNFSFLNGIMLFSIR